MATTVRSLYAKSKSLDAHLGLVLDRLVQPQAGNQESSVEVKHLVQRRGKHPPAGYKSAFKRWQRATAPGVPYRRVLRFRAVAPLRVGGGRPSPLENHLALHPTWGVPIIPGSAIKGVVRAWLTESYQGDPDWGPGSDWFRILLGQGADASDDGASAGSVDFLDALVEPARYELVRDVATPHHHEYYQGKGKRPPAGMEGPNPITFLAARGVFRVVLEGAPELLDVAAEIVERALKEHGVGGKTRAGYGRLERVPGLDIYDEQLKEERWLDNFDSFPADEQVAWVVRNAGTAFPQNAKLWLHDKPVQDQLADIFARLSKTDEVRRAVLNRLKPHMGDKKWRELKREVLKPEGNKHVEGAHDPQKHTTPPTAAAGFGDYVLTAKDKEIPPKKKKKKLDFIKKTVKRFSERTRLSEESYREILAILEEAGAKPGQLKALRNAYEKE